MNPTTETDRSTALMAALQQPPASWAETPCIPFEGRGFRRTGYGYLQFGGKQYEAHRLAFAINQGLMPSDLRGVVVRHTCDNPACVNVGHLMFGTAADNMRDKVKRGRQLNGAQIPQAKLTDEQAAEIRSLYRPYSKDANQYVLAQRFGVTQSAVSHVLSGRNWKHVQ